MHTQEIDDPAGSLVGAIRLALSQADSATALVLFADLHFSARAGDPRSAAAVVFVMDHLLADYGGPKS